VNTYPQDIRIGSTYVGDPLDGATAGAVARWTGAAVDYIGRALERLRRYRIELRARRESEARLLGMSDRDLRDIGLTRHELREVYRNAWI
jgi:uncharacterized protein YjiS (DUF1127 family)